MPRVIIHKQKGPAEIKCGETSHWVCQCGLSKNQPFCDGSHKLVLTEDDEKIYRYDEDGKRIEVN